MLEKIIEVIVLLPSPTLETLYMTLVSTILACIMGFPLGAYLCCASPAGLNPRNLSYNTLSRIVNLLRSLPFIILMILLVGRCAPFHN